MDLKPATPLRLAPPGLALNRPEDSKKIADVAHRFEALIAVSLLRSARAADLGDDGLGASSGPIRDMIDTNRAEAIARAAPLGVARLLEKERAGK